MDKIDPYADSIGVGFGGLLMAEGTLGMRRGRSEVNGGVSGTEGVVSRGELLPGAFIKLTLLARQYNRLYEHRHRSAGQMQSSIHDQAICN